MDDLTRFCLGWTLLLAIVAMVVFFRPLARFVIAIMLARAFRAVARPSDLLDGDR